MTGRVSSGQCLSARLCEGSGKRAHGAEQTVGLQERQPGVAQNVPEMKSKVVGAIFHINTLHFYFNFSEKFIYSCQYNTYFYCSNNLCHQNKCCKNQAHRFDALQSYFTTSLSSFAAVRCSSIPNKIYYNNNNKNMTTKPRVIIYMPFIQGHAYFLVANTCLMSAVFKYH